MFYDQISLDSTYNKTISDKSSRENQKRKHFMLNNFYLQNCDIYETMWKNMAEPDRRQMSIKYGACTLHDRYLKLQTNT